MPHFAWPSYEEPWECTVESVSFDEADGGECIDADHLRIDAYEREWVQAQVMISLTTTEPAPAGLGDLRAHVLLSCPMTQLRRPFPIDATEENGRLAFRGAVCIQRSAVAGKVSLVSEIVGHHEGRRRVVASTLPWALIVDKAAAPRKAGVPPLKTIWVEFGANEAPTEARRHSGAHAYVDITLSPPILYLNKGIDGLQSLILADKPKLERRRHRDLISAFIARYVASTLFRAAAEQVTTDEFGGPAEGPTGQVFRDICEAVAVELPYTETVQDLYETIARLPDGPPESAVFWADVDLALDRMTSVSSTVAAVSEQVKYV